MLGCLGLRGDGRHKGTGEGEQMPGLRLVAKAQAGLGTHLLMCIGSRLAVHRGAVGEGQAQVLGEVSQDPAQAHARALQRLHRHGQAGGRAGWLARQRVERAEPTPSSQLRVVRTALPSESRPSTHARFRAGDWRPAERPGLRRSPWRSEEHTAGPAWDCKLTC